ncbi:MAG: TRAM domain-containing protein, partial [Ruminococcus sp.]|nr:TRAM domain-containing protein [Ruminococcus sp.]
MFMLKKNDEVILEITGMTNEGNGVGRYEGIAVFVAGSAVGDVIACRIVKVSKNYCYGIINRIITPSEHRIRDNCPVSKTCGGCCFRHISYRQECLVKEQFIRDSFERIGKLRPQYDSFVGSENIS